MISINVAISEVNRDIVVGDGYTILISGFAAGSNLDGKIVWRCEFGPRPTRRGKQKDNQRELLRHRNAEGYRSKGLLQRQKARGASTR